MRVRVRRRPRALIGVGVGVGTLAVLVWVTACSNASTSSSSNAGTTNPATANAGSARTGSSAGASPSGSDVERSPAGEVVVFNAEGNNLDAFTASPPFTSQRVNTANHSFGGAPSDPNGLDINGQICSFERDGRRYLITGEDTGQPERPAGWGVFELSGTKVGDLSIRKVAKLVPTYQDSADGPDNYGCGVLADGRIVTTDIGNDAVGAANGQLEIWFPPYDSEHVSFCKLDTLLATGQSIYVDRDDKSGAEAIYVVSPRPAAEEGATASGVFRYDGPFPTSADAKGGCGATDNLGSPMADQRKKTKVLGNDAKLFAPSGITRAPNGHWFVSSVITGVINEYDSQWNLVQTVLEPPAGEALGEKPFSTGTPLGITAGPDGAIYYADIGIVRGGSAGFGPGPHTGSLRRITFENGAPRPPETMAADRQFPDGVGVVVLSAA